MHVQFVTPAVYPFVPRSQTSNDQGRTAGVTTTYVRIILLSLFNLHPHFTRPFSSYSGVRPGWRVARACQTERVPGGEFVRQCSDP